MPKSDGFSDGHNTFQGVRTYDPQAGAWTTPDAYRGDVHDPMSQKPYMWNRNNPYAYSDPSGYCVEGKNVVASEIATLVSSIDFGIGALVLISFIIPGGAEAKGVEAAEGILVIGKLADLDTLGAGEFTLAETFDPLPGIVSGQLA